MRGKGEHSDGGNILVWSDHDTYFEKGANINIAGGEQSGDGGFAEVSGKNTVTLGGSVHGKSVDGVGGRLLVDPTDIVVGPGVTDGTTTYYDPVPGSFNGLSSIDLLADQNLTVQNAFNVDSTTGNTGTQLTLRAGRNLSVNADVTTQNASLNLLADNNNDGVGTLSIASGANVSSNGGQITMQGRHFDLDGTVNAGAGTVAIQPGNNSGIQVGNTDVTNIDTGAGAMIVSASELSQITAGTVQIGTTGRTGGLSLQGGAYDISSRYNMTLANGGNITNASNSHIITGSKWLDLNTNAGATIITALDGAGLSFRNITAPSGLTLRTQITNSPITISNPLSFSNNNITVSLEAWISNLSLNSLSHTGTGGSVNLQAGFRNAGVIMNSAATLDITNGLTISNDSGKTVNFWGGSGNYLNHSFFNQNLSFGTLHIRTGAANMPIDFSLAAKPSALLNASTLSLVTLGSNSPITMGTGFTGTNLSLLTLGGNSPISVNGAINTSNLTLATSNSPISVNGTINTSTNLNVDAGSSSMIISGDFNNTGGTIARIVGGSGVSLTGNINITESASKAFTIYDGSGAIFTKDYFTQSRGTPLQFSSIDWRQAAPNTPWNWGDWSSKFTTGNLRLDAYGVNSAINIPTSFSGTSLYLNTTGTNSPITVNGNINTSSNLNLYSPLNSINVLGDITNTGGSGTSVDLQVGGGTTAGTLLNVTGNLNITQHANKNLSFYEASGGIFNKSFFNSRITANGLSLRSATDIKTEASPLLTDVNFLSVITTGSAYVSELNNVQLGITSHNTFASSSTTGTYKLIAGGNITNARGLSAGFLDLSTTNNGNITISASTPTISGTNGINLTTNGTGLVTVNSGMLLSSTSGNINIQAHNLDLPGSISAGTGTVTLTPNGNKSMTLASAGTGSGTFDVNAAELSRITAGRLIVGDTLQSGDLTLAGGLDVSGAGAGNYDLNLLNAGNIDTTGQSITLGGKTLTMQAGGALSTGSITGSNSTISLTGGTAANILGALSMNTSGTVTVESTNNGNISIGEDVLGAGGVTLAAQGSGIINVLAGKTVSTSNNNLSLTAHDATIAGLLNAGTGTVTLAPNGNKDITLATSGSGSGTFDISQTEMSNITAGSLVVGHLSRSGGLGIANNINLAGTGAGKYNLSLLNAGDVNATGRTLTLGTRNLVMNSGGNLYTGSVSGNDNTLSLTGGSVTVNGPLSVANTGSITAATTSNGNINIADSIGAADTVSLTANGSGSLVQTGSGTVTANTINLTSSTGDIGSLVNPIRIAANTLSVSTGAPGSVYLSEADQVTLNASQAGNNFRLLANNHITVSGLLSAADVNLETTGNGNISIGENVLGSGGVTLATQGSGIINVLAGKTVSTSNNNLSLTAHDLDLSGSINAGAATVTLTPNGNKSMTLASAGTGSGTFDVNAAELSRITAGRLIAGDVLKSGDLTLVGGLDVSGAGAGSYHLNLLNAGNIDTTGQSITLGEKTLTMQADGALSTGSITGSNSTISLTGGTAANILGALSMNTSGTVTVESTNNGNIQLNNNLTAANSITLNANGTGNITRSGMFTLNAPSISLTSGSGNIGTALSRIQTAATNLQASTDGNIYLRETDAVNLLGSRAGSIFDLQAGTSLTVNGDVEANEINLATTADNGFIHLNNELVGAQTVSLSTAGLNSPITQSASQLLRANNLSIQTADGDIGQSTNFFNVDTDTLQVNTPDNVYIYDINAVEIDNTHVGGLLHLKANGSISLTGTVTSGSILLQPNITDGPILTSSPFIPSYTSYTSYIPFILSSFVSGVAPSASHISAYSSPSGNVKTDPADAGLAVINSDTSQRHSVQPQGQTSPVPIIKRFPMLINYKIFKIQKKMLLMVQRGLNPVKWFIR